MNFQEIGGQGMNGGINGGAGQGGMVSMGNFQGSMGGWHIKQKPLMGLIGSGGGLAAAGSGREPADPTPVTYVIIGGGGSGGNDCGGGAGAGGYITGTTSALAGDNDMTVTVGAGGVVSTPTSPGGKQGSDSVFDCPAATYTALGGGHGGGFSPAFGGNGGSGGAARRDTTVGPTDSQATGYGTPTSQGHPAVYPYPSKPTGVSSSGGGGISGNGTVGDSSNAGSGGAAILQPILAPINSGWVAGGGGGGVDTPTVRIGFGGGQSGGVAPTVSSRSGGAGGGGGSPNPEGAWMQATQGVDNTGGGGGGGAGNSGPPTAGSAPTYRDSGAGGKGVVALVYPPNHTISNPGGGLTYAESTHSPTEMKTIFTDGTGTIQLISS